MLDPPKVTKHSPSILFWVKFDVKTLVLRLKTCVPSITVVESSVAVVPMAIPVLLPGNED
jgi:hypothetical protein